MSHEDILAIIKLGPILLFLIIFLYGLIVGMIKGNRKVIRRFIYVAIYLTALIISLPYITRAAMTVEINGFTIENYITEMATSNEAINGVLTKIPGLLDIVVEFPSAILSMLLFVVLTVVGLPLSFPIYWLYLIFYNLISRFIFKYTRFEKNENGEFVRNQKGKKIKKKKKYRVVAGVIRGVQYVLVTSIVLTPIGFVTRLYKVGKETSQTKDLANITYFENFDEYLAYIDAYNNSFIGFVSDNALNEAISNHLTQMEIEGEKTTIEAELSAFIKASVYVEESGMIKVLSTGADIQTLDLSEVDTDKLNLAIEALFESKILDSLVGDGVNYVMETYLNEQLVNLTGDVNIVSKLKYSSSSEVKEELTTVVTLLKTIINAKLLDAYKSANGDVVGMINSVSTNDVETILNKVLSVKILSKAMPGIMNTLLDDYGLVETLTEQNNSEFVSLILDAVNLVKALELESTASVMEGNMIDNIVNVLYKNGTINSQSIDALSSLLARITSSNAFDDILVTQLNNLLRNFDINLNARMIANVNTKEDWKAELSVLDGICKLYKDYTTTNKVDFLVVNDLMSDLKDTKAMILAFPIAYKTIFPMLNIEIDSSKIVYVDYSKEGYDEEEDKFYAYWKEQLVGLETISTEFVKLDVDSMDDVSLDLLKVEENKQVIANILATAFGMDLLKKGVVTYLDTMIGDMLAQYEITLNDGAIANVNALVEAYPKYVVVDEVEYNVDVENKYYIDGEEYVVTDKDIIHDNTLNRVWYNEVDNLSVVITTITTSSNFTQASTLTTILNAVDSMVLLKDVKVDLLVYAIGQSGLFDVGEIDKSIIDFNKEKEILISVVEKQETINSLSGIVFSELTKKEQEDIGDVLNDLMRSDIFSSKIVDTLAGAITETKIYHDAETDMVYHAELKKTIKSVSDWTRELGVIKTLTSIKSASGVDESLFETIEGSELFGACKYNILIMMVNTINDNGGITLNVPTIEELDEYNEEHGKKQYEVEKQIFIKATTLDGVSMDTLISDDTDDIGEVLSLMADSKIFNSKYDSFVNDIKTGVANDEYGITVDNSIDTTTWSASDWEAELNKLIAIKDGVKNLPENAEDADATTIGALLDTIHSSVLIGENCDSIVANKIAESLFGMSSIDKQGTWTNTFQELLN